MYISILEDNEKDARLLSSYIQKYFTDNSLECELSIYYSAREFQENCEYSLVDIIFIDIYIGSQNGMNIAKQLRKTGYQGIFVFCTITPSYALAGYEVNAQGYIIKPYDYQSIEKLLDNIQKVRDSETPDIRIKENRTWYKIRTTSIIYVDSHGNYIHIHTSSKMYRTRMTLKQIWKQLSVNYCFVQCNSGTVINLAKVKEISKHTVVLESKDGKDTYSISPSRYYASAVQEQYNHYIFKKAGIDL